MEREKRNCLYSKDETSLPFGLQPPGQRCPWTERLQGKPSLRTGELWGLNKSLDLSEHGHSYLKMRNDICLLWCGTLSGQHGSCLARARAEETI